MAINGSAMGIDEVFLTMIPSMGIETFDLETSFDLDMFKISTNSCHLGFSVYLSFVWNFEDAQIFYSGMKLYIVIHIVYLCEKRDSVDFPRKKHQIFVKTYFKLNSCIFQIFFLLTSRLFSQQWSSIPSHFHTYKCNSARFCNCFSNNSRARLRKK